MRLLVSNTFLLASDQLKLSAATTSDTTFSFSGCHGVFTCVLMLVICIVMAGIGLGVAVGIMLTVLVMTVVIITVRFPLPCRNGSSCKLSKSLN